MSQYTVLESSLLAKWRKYCLQKRELSIGFNIQVGLLRRKLETIGMNLSNMKATDDLDRGWVGGIKA